MQVELIRYGQKFFLGRLKDVRVLCIPLVEYANLLEKGGELPRRQCHKDPGTFRADSLKCM
ncbi:hypothetical protein ACPOL_4857 [Acidisarcina polymorpha]|uniref:Uncharacterized protein n=1 Tax=Acidisarcina polymorpha TaxID=2211140 RepID=A0A2Z5G597_9BACT|nr:hypothetical protein ACPOL_4857 [Acidisarcina polymorpha]